VPASHTLVDLDAVGTATDFGPTALRLTGAAEALVEVSASALIWAWAMGALLPWLSP
jgi:hypothetical protein